MTSLSEYHAKFPGGKRWKVTSQGVEVEGDGLVKFDTAMFARATALCGKHADAFTAASSQYGVPVELLMACTLTEGAAKDPETCVRQEPGYVSDDKTPAKVSAGMCQLLISTAAQHHERSKHPIARGCSIRRTLDAFAAYINLTMIASSTG